MMAYYLYRLLPYRADFATTMTDEERAAMHEHVEYWRSLLQDGKVLVFSPVADPTRSWGLAIVEGDEAELAALRAGDPALRAGVADADFLALPSPVVRPTEVPVGKAPTAAFAYMVIHSPRPEHREDLVAAMLDAGTRMVTHDECTEAGPWIDPSGQVIGWSAWTSRQAFESALPPGFDTIGDGVHPFETRPRQRFHLARIQRAEDHRRELAGQ